jgi:cytoskeletal protein RodZ
MIKMMVSRSIWLEMQLTNMILVTSKPESKAEDTKPEEVTEETEQKEEEPKSEEKSEEKDEDDEVEEKSEDKETKSEDTPSKSEDNPSASSATAASKEDIREILITKAKADAAAAKAEADAKLNPEQEFKPTIAKPVAAAPPAPYTVETHPNREDLNRLRGRVAVLHFTAMVKPWAMNVEALKKEHIKQRHPDMIEQLKDWREKARTKCPRVRVPKTGKNADGEMEWFHYVNNI